MARAQTSFPPLFLWLIANGGSGLRPDSKRRPKFTRGVPRTNKCYCTGALPVSILLLAQMILWQVVPLMRSMVWMIEHTRRYRGKLIPCKRRFLISPIESRAGCRVVGSRLSRLCGARTSARCRRRLLYCSTSLTLPMRRSERARIFLELSRAGLEPGQNGGGSIIAVSASRDRILGTRYSSLAEYLRSGKRFSEALGQMPRLLPPQVIAMLPPGNASEILPRFCPLAGRY